MVVQRYDPFRSTVGLRSMLDQLMDESFLRPFNPASEAAALPIDLVETDEAYELRASLPGIDPEHLQISVQDNMVTIRGETAEEQERQGRRYLVRERRMGRFERTVMLPNPIDSDRAKAKFEHGVLELTLPKSASAKPKQIKIENAKSGTRS